MEKLARASALNQSSDVRERDSMIKRRRFLGSVASALLAAPYAAQAHAQQPAKLPRVGYLGFNTAETARDHFAAFRQGLRERGWVEGQNIRIEARFADGQRDRLPGLVAELAQLKVDVIVAGSSASTMAIRNATRTIPVVMAASADALGEGFVTSLAHPSGIPQSILVRADEIRE